MYSYHDFVTHEVKHTRGTFEKWSEPTGPLDVRYAIFKNPRGRVCVPAYLLTQETKARLPKPVNDPSP